MTDYYKLLVDPNTEWMAEENALFRFPTSFKGVPFIQCHLRHFRRDAPRLLVRPVVEKPSLYVPSTMPGNKTGKKRWILSDSRPPGSPRVRFNWEMQQCIDRWHVEAEKLGCNHSAPLLRLMDDSPKQLSFNFLVE